MTLTEIVLASAIITIVSAAFAVLLNTLRGSVTHTQKVARHITIGHQIFAYLEQDLYNANEIQDASGDSITIICDINRSPNFNPNLDPDLDGINNDKDADRDGDINAVAAAADQWKVGLNLPDDDEDGDNQIDVRIRFFLDGNNKLIRDMSINGDAWGSREFIIARDVESISFNYFGSVENDLGQNLDNGADGLPGTSDAGEGDGIIDEGEIDATLPANGGDGNNNGQLDLALERMYITSIRIEVLVGKGQVNQNVSTHTYVSSQRSFTTQVYPPMLPLKPLQRG